MSENLQRILNELNESKQQKFEKILSKYSQEQQAEIIKSISDILFVEEGIMNINIEIEDFKKIINSDSDFYIDTISIDSQNIEKEIKEKILSKNISIKNLLINIAGNADLTINEVYNCAHIIGEKCDEDGECILGCYIDETIEPNTLKITIIATIK